jgi:nucleotide-binding universal stress UspA family protein
VDRNITESIQKSCVTDRMEGVGILAYGKEIEVAGLKFQTELLEGPVAEAIMNVAETRDADLIVLGARGMSSLEGLLLGSVSQKVIHHTTCPVLVVH